jgi:vacuolar protein sorting-associated protein 13A/C
VKGASKKGFGGFGLGLLKGVTGLVTKPITGIVDGVSKTAEGIKNTTKIF